MKVAVCISGFLRTWEQTRESFSQFFQGVDVDIYAQVYRQNYYEYSAQKKDVTYSDEEVRNFFSGLNVVDLVIEDAIETREKNRSDCEKYKNVANYGFQIKESSDPDSKTVPLGERIYDQLRTIQVSADLYRRSGKRYDIIVKTRYDVLYLSKPDWQSLLDDKVHCEIGACGGYPNEIVVGGTPTAVIPILDRFAHLGMLFASEKPIQENSRIKDQENSRIKDQENSRIKDQENSRKNQEKDQETSNCECGHILPCCSMCSHATFRHLLDYYKTEIGQSICHSLVLRSESLVHIPFQGTTSYQSRTPESPRAP